MLEKLQFYIDGQWVDPVEPRTMDVVNPATEEIYGRISLGSSADVDIAVAAANRAFEAYSQTTREERIALLEAILSEFAKRHDEVAEAIMDEMGAPWGLAGTRRLPAARSISRPRSRRSGPMSSKSVLARPIL